MYYFEPYKSCSLFGTLRYFSNIKNSICLIHGPSGCAFFNRNGIIRLNGYYSAPYKIDIPKIFCTGYNENDAIFGAEDKLKTAVRELLRTFSPDVIFIFNCCVTEITGENIDDIAKSISRESGVMCIPVHSAGFKGDHKVGMHMAVDLLFRYFITEPHKIRKRSVNILADFDYFNNTSAELVKILNRIGVTDITHVPGRCTVTELKECNGAELNIVACGFAGRKFAEMFKKKYGTPYIGNGIDFYGISKSYLLYCSLCNFYSCDKSWLVAMKNEAFRKLSEYKPFFAGRHAVIVAGMRRSVGYSEILTELGVKIDFIFSECDERFYSNDIYLQYSENIMCNDPAMRLYDIVEEKKPDIVLSTLSELIAPHKYITRTDEDFAGFEGALRFAEYIKTNLEKIDRSLFVQIQN